MSSREAKPADQLKAADKLSRAVVCRQAGKPAGRQASRQAGRQQPKPCRPPCAACTTPCWPTAQGSCVEMVTVSSWGTRLLASLSSCSRSLSSPPARGSWAGKKIECYIGQGRTGQPAQDRAACPEGKVTTWHPALQAGMHPPTHPAPAAMCARCPGRAASAAPGRSCRS